MKKPDITSGKWILLDEQLEDEDSLYLVNNEEGLAIHDSFNKVNAQAIHAVPDMLDALIGAYKLSDLWEPDMDTVPPEYEGEAEALMKMKESIEQALKKAGCS